MKLHRGACLSGRKDTHKTSGKTFYSGDFLRQNSTAVRARFGGIFTSSRLQRSSAATKKGDKYLKPCHLHVFRLQQKAGTFVVCQPPRFSSLFCEGSFAIIQHVKDGLFRLLDTVTLERRLQRPELRHQLHVTLHLERPTQPQEEAVFRSFPLSNSKL